MSGIFSPKSKNARPLDMRGLGQAGRAFQDGSLGRPGALRGSVLPNYTPITSIQGLGQAFRDGSLGTSAAPGEIPWQCWGVQAFQDCHAANWAAAQKDCASGSAAKYGMTVDDCTAAFSAGNDGSNCVPKYCGQYAAIANSTATLAAATVKKAQTQLNADLARGGYKTITVDGKLGPATCGAANYLYSSTPRQSTVWSDYNLYAYCSASGTNPTLVGATKPLTTYVAPPVSIVQGQETPALIVHQWGTQDAQMPELQGTINRILDSYGYNSIPVTGKLDAQTCGAMKWIADTTGNNLLAMNGQNCQAFTLPTKKPASQSPSTAPKGSGPPTVAPPAPTPPGKHPISTAGLVMGGVAFAVAGGLYYYAKKKGMV